MKSLILILSLFLINSTNLKASVPVDSVVRPQLRTSQTVIASSNSSNCYVKVTYGQPLKRGRVVFGGIVPYGKLWRTGANEATEITFTKNVKFGESTVEAGTYSLFTIPNKDKWTIILNSDLGQWGADAYDSTKNVTSFNIAVENNNSIQYEGFTVSVSQNSNDFFVDLLWDKTRVRIPTSVQMVIEETKKKKKRWFGK